MLLLCFPCVCCLAGAPRGSARPLSLHTPGLVWDSSQSTDLWEFLLKILGEFLPLGWEGEDNTRSQANTGAQMHPEH